MPLVAVAGAFAGASALAAGGLTVWGTIGAIGAIVGGIGALTGNEDMMKIGAVAGLAGGVGGFASGQGWISGGGASNVINDASVGGNIQGALSAPAPGLEGGASGAMNNPSAFINDAAGATANLDAGSIANNIGQSSGLMDAMNPTDMRLASGTQTTPLMQEAASSLMPTNSPEEGGIMGTLKKFGTFMKENKELSSMAGNFIGGMFDDEKKAKTELYEARAEAERQQLKNGSDIPRLNFQSKKPNASVFRPGTPTYNAPRPGGLFYAK